MPDDIIITGSNIKGNGIAIGSKAKSVYVNLNTTNKQGDEIAFDKLYRELANHGVFVNDIFALRAAISLDANSNDVLQHKFGPKVKSWMKNMFAKAVDTSWQIEIGMAGSLLASAISRYYGWL